MRRMKKRPSVLVVDDDPLFRTIIARVLRDIAVISEACDGHEAYETARRSRPDLVVLDLNMPRWDGVQTIRAFRNVFELQSVPILITSGSLESDPFHEACSIGIAGFVPKADVCEDSFIRLVQKSLNDISLRSAYHSRQSVIAMQTT